jgi:predicted RNase H-like nuclease
MIFVGTDGCKKGWLAVKLTDGLEWETRVFEDIGTLWVDFHDAAIILLIDIPIGLKDDGPNERECDLLARKLLGNKRAASVFRPPCRKAVYSPIDKSSDINFRITKKRLPLQTLNIIPKIREVDTLLSNDQSARLQIREIHPEICFWALSGGRPMQYSKKKQEGFFERQKILESVYTKTEAIGNEASSDYRRSEVARDDVIDALVAAVTAKIGFNRFLTIPDTPPIDSKGLRMEMVYFPLEGVA